MRYVISSLNLSKDIYDNFVLVVTKLPSPSPYEVPEHLCNLQILGIIFFPSHFSFLILTHYQIPATYFSFLDSGSTSVRWGAGQNIIHAICNFIILLHVGLFHNREVGVNLSVLSFPTQFEVPAKNRVSSDHGFQKTVLGGTLIAPMGV